ncbi:gluconate kinase [Enterococcus sp. 10A9_DIV0425]|uniref:Gluconate kinase n=1 Tax=Candidatus Enterococcus wittei TaxID=1987383 RepID=A0A242JVY2_9ENTE|nr:gluconokinase [Enterococcus sp. 10A9_DIV0425]OTP06949.1 gluconate kinase [Enterococcus sp. 10A9_DIV0425]THE07437.1 gluconate kinase [Enterococcus hirae]
MFAIGVDIGTTQTKAVAFNEQAEEVAVAYFHYPLIQETEGMAEQDQELILQGVYTVINEVIRQLPTRHVRFISFSTAMHSLILLDKNKVPLTRMLTWADTRAVQEAEILKNTTKGKAFYELTGTPIHPMSPLIKIQWLKRTYPELIEKTAYYVGIKEYIFDQLFGELVCDYSTASGTGYFDYQKFQWAEEILQDLGISAEQLPKLANSTTQFRHFTSTAKEKCIVDEGTPFILGGADGPLSNLGLGAFGETTAALTVGTSGALRFISQKPQLHPEMETFCYVLDQEHWVIGGATSNGAGIFDWAVHTFMQEVVQKAKSQGQDPYEAILEEIAFVPPGANGLLFHPYLLGERAPVWEADAFGSFIGLQRRHTEKEMMRAVLEGICLNLKRILVGICKEDQVTEIRATGGFAQSLLFRQIMTDVLGQPIVFPKVKEASALGAVILGWQSLGQIIELSEAKRVIHLKVQVPVDVKAKNIYEKMYPLFVSTQQQLGHYYQEFADLRQVLSIEEKNAKM